MSHTPNGRLNPRNIVGTDENGEVLYAGGNVRRKPVPAAPEPEPVAERYCLTFFDADDNLLTDWYTATSLEDAMKLAEAEHGLGIDYHAHSTEPSIPRASLSAAEQRRISNSERAKKGWRRRREKANENPDNT